MKNHRDHVGRVRDNSFICPYFSARTGCFGLVFLVVALASAPVGARTLTIAPGSRMQGTSAGGDSFAITSDIPWRAWANTDWLTVVGVYPQGLTNGTVSYEHTSNSGYAARTGTITVAGGGITRTFTFTQTGSAQHLAINPAERFHGQDVSVRHEINVAANSAWTAASDSSWLIITNGASGTGNGKVYYRLNRNSHWLHRTATILISNGSYNRVFQISQNGGDTNRTMTIDIESLAITDQTRVTNRVVSNLDWQAIRNQGWITVIGSSMGSGTRNIEFQIARNSSSAPRTGTVTFRGPVGHVRTFTITQAPGAYAYFTQNRRDFTGDEHDTVGLTVFANASWSLFSSNTWITVAPSAIGSGNGTHTYRVSPNPNPARHGTIQVRTSGGLQGDDMDFVHIYQQAAALTINPLSRSHGPAAVSGQTIGISANVQWRTTTNQPWIIVTSGVSGGGNGTVMYRLEANEEGPRSGNIHVFGGGLSRSFNIDQTGSALPHLLLRPSGSGAALLAWPSDEAGYVMQRRPSLMTGAWVDQAGSPVVVGHEHQFIITPTNDAHFYRLHKP